METTLLPIVILDNLLSSKAPPSILVTPVPITAVVNLLPKKASDPIISTLSGIVTLNKLFPRNASTPMPVTLYPSIKSGIMSSEGHPLNQVSHPVIVASSPFRV